MVTWVSAMGALLVLVLLVGGGPVGRSKPPSCEVGQQGAGGGGVPCWSATVLASCLLVGRCSSPARATGCLRASWSPPASRALRGPTDGPAAPLTRPSTRWQPVQRATGRSASGRRVPGRGAAGEAGPRQCPHRRPRPGGGGRAARAAGSARGSPPGALPSPPGRCPARRMVRPARATAAAIPTGAGSSAAGSGRVSSASGRVAIGSTGTGTVMGGGEDAEVDGLAGLDDPGFAGLGPQRTCSRIDARPVPHPGLGEPPGTVEVQLPVVLKDPLLAGQGQQPLGVRALMHDDPARAGGEESRRSMAAR